MFIFVHIIVISVVITVNLIICIIVCIPERFLSIYLSATLSENGLQPIIYDIVNIYLNPVQFKNVYNSYLFFLYYSRVLSFRSGATSGVTVSLQECARAAGAPGSANITDCDDEPVTNPKWQKLGGDFQPINLQSIEGRNLPNKLEMLMAALTDV